MFSFQTSVSLDRKLDFFFIVGTATINTHNNNNNNKHPQQTPTGTETQKVFSYLVVIKGPLSTAHCKLGHDSWVTCVWWCSVAHHEHVDVLCKIWYKHITCTASPSLQWLAQQKHVIRDQEWNPWCSLTHRTSQEPLWLLNGSYTSPETKNEQTKTSQSCILHSHSLQGVFTLCV